MEDEFQETYMGNPKGNVEIIRSNTIDGGDKKWEAEICGRESKGKKKKKIEEIAVSFQPLSDGDGNKGAAEICEDESKEGKRKRKRKKKEAIVVSPYFISKQKFEPLSDCNGNKGKSDIREGKKKKKEVSVVSPYFMKKNMSCVADESGQHNEHKFEPLSDGNGNKVEAEICESMGKRKKQRKKKEEIFVSPYFIKNRCFQFEMNMDECRQQCRNNEQKFVPLSNGEGAAEISGNDGRESKGKRKREGKKKEEIVASPYFTKNRPEMNVGVDESRRHGRNYKQQCEASSDGYGNEGAAEVCGDKRGKRKRVGKKKKEEIVASPYFLKNRCCQLEMNMRVGSADETNKQKLEALSDGDGRENKEKNVVSPYFMKVGVDESSRLQGRNSKQKYGAVSDGDGNFCGLENKKRERKKESQLEKKDPGDESRLGKKEILCSVKDTHQNVEESARGLKEKSGKKKRRVEVEVLGGQKMENASLDDLFLRFRYTGGKRVVSPYFANTRNHDVSPYLCKSGQTPKSKVQTKTRCSPTLTSAQKKDEAYRRTPSSSTWTPPRSPFNLLQEDHAFDPWRVLVICMLLNQTTGRQAGTVLSKLFELCPNAKAATEVGTEEIEKEIRSLGLQKKRALGIQQLSRDYLDESWTHVTQLSGVGKYAADAYAIFCTGQWQRVKPVDHKLVEYWNFLSSSNHTAAF